MFIDSLRLTKTRKREIVLCRSIPIYLFEKVVQWCLDEDSSPVQLLETRTPPLLMVRDPKVMVQSSCHWSGHRLLST